MRLLVATDGSDVAFAAVQCAIRLARAIPGSEIHLLNVRRPIKGTAATFVGRDVIRQYHEEEGQAALARGEAALRESGLKFESHIARGHAGPTISDYALEHDCDLIVMGTRGAGAVQALLGSTANEVLEHAKVPVVLVKE